MDPHAFDSDFRIFDMRLPTFLAITVVIENGVGIGVDFDFGLVDRYLIFVPEKSCNFFKGQSAGVGKEEKDDETPNERQEDKEKIKFPTRSSGLVSKLFHEGGQLFDILKGHRCRLRVYHVCKR